METKMDLRRIGIFLGIAFGITWLIGPVFYLTGGLVNSWPIAPRVSLAKLLLAILYTWAPAVANILTRLLTGEGWKDLGLRPRFRQGWLYWLIGWVLPALMTISGAVIFFIVFPMYFDPGLTRVQQILFRIPILASFSPWAAAVIITMAGVLISPLVLVWLLWGKSLAGVDTFYPSFFFLVGAKRCS